ncbi:DUF177 domain-containing protein [Chloroflexota bacterium]|nr:DUF177 domain-containing protein [Chloroflexota bacterium]
MALISRTFSGLAEATSKVFFIIDLHKVDIITLICVDGRFSACYNSTRVDFLPNRPLEFKIVNNRDNPLRLSVGYFYNKPIGYSREIFVEAEHLELDDLLVDDLQSRIIGSRTSEGLLLQVEGTAEVETNCVRCLKDFFLSVNFDFEELYQFPSRTREETDLILPADGYIDLRPLYREYLILALPIKRLCKPDCKGLCVVCGTNLNYATCEHQTNPPEHEDIEGKETV